MAGVRCCFVLHSLAIISGQRQPPFNFFWSVWKHPVVEPRSPGVARIQSFDCDFACASQHRRDNRLHKRIAEEPTKSPRND